MPKFMLRAPLLLLVLLVGCGEAGVPAVDGAAADAAAQSTAPVPELPAARVDGGTRAQSVSGDPALSPAADLSARLETLRAQRRTRARWWDDASIAAEIGLEDSQRAAIEARVAEQASRSERTQAEVAAAREQFRNAIAAGELERAREAARREAALASELQLAQRLLLVEVLATLDPQQRAALVARHPGALSTMATRAARAQRGGRNARQSGREDGVDGDG